jgi:hypothetical protein
VAFGGQIAYAPLQAGESGTIDVQGRTVKVGVQGARLEALNQMIPLGRGGTPEEAAGAVYLFCSPDSDYVSGQTLVVNGGCEAGKDRAVASLLTTEPGSAASDLPYPRALNAAPERPPSRRHLGWIHHLRALGRFCMTELVLIASGLVDRRGRSR